MLFLFQQNISNLTYRLAVIQVLHALQNQKEVEIAVTVDVHPKKEYLYIQLKGAFELKSMMDAQENIMEACVLSKTRKVMVDFREMTGEISPQDRFQFAEAGSLKYAQLLNEGRIKNCRFAYLGKVPQLDPGRLGETVAVNRGVMVKATESLKEAFEWLGVEQDTNE